MQLKKKNRNNNKKVVKRKRFDYCYISVCVLLFLFYSNSLIAQKYIVKMHTIDNNELLLSKNVILSSSYASSALALNAIQNIVPNLQKNGYLSASVDSIAVNGVEYEVYIFLGKSYQWAKVNFDNISQGIMTQTAINKKAFEGRILDPKQIGNVTEKLLQWAENNGYPFAKVWLGAINIDTDGKVNGSFKMEQGSIQKIDSVGINGNLKISRNYLLNYLDIKQGSLYDEKKIKNISKRLKELPFLQEYAPWNFVFKASENQLNLYLKEKKANQLNAIIGLIPNSTQTGKLLLTVDAQFAFQNILSEGESIKISYQNLQYKSPRLNADLVYPYLLNSPIGLDAHFDLYKQDTIFRRTSLQLGLRYQFTPTDHIRLFYQNQSNRLITIDTAYVRANKKLPDNIDVSANGIGLEISLNKTDYRISPRKGWDVRFSSSALVRSVRKSDAITGLSDASGFDFGHLYDTVTKRKNQYFINGDFNYYFSFGKKVVLKTTYNGGWIGGVNLFRNELYQIGGFKLLRGFDEQSIVANQYHVISLELRLLIDQNSYFYMFSDNGYVQSNFNGYSKDDIYDGLGIGTTLETKTGLFSVSYAVGRNNENPFQLRQSKIHFGYVAYF